MNTIAYLGVGRLFLRNSKPKIVKFRLKAWRVQG